MNPREFWQLGQRSAERPVAPGSRMSEARRLHCSPEQLRTARAFFSRCPEAELEKLLAEAAAVGYEPGATLLGALFEVLDRAMRRKLWAGCLAGKWTRAELQRAKSQAVGNLNSDRGGGRTFKLRDRRHGLQLLREQIAAMIRLLDQLGRVKPPLPRPTAQRLGRLRQAIAPFRR